MQTIEERLDQLEKRNRRLTAALAVLTVAICAVVTMAATGEKDGDFDVVTAKAIFVKNDAGKVVVSLGATDDGDGLVYTTSAQGKDLVKLTATVDDEGTVTTFAPNGKMLVELGANAKKRGVGLRLDQLEAFRCDLVDADTGGMVRVFNKTGEEVVQLRADEYGNGVVGAFNRKGVGRMLQPGP